MVADYYGIRISLDEADSLCHASNRGVSMWAISQGVEKIGLVSKAMKMTIKSLKETTCPTILFWNQNHFVVYYGKTLFNKYKIADPGKGKYTVSESELKSKWIASNDIFADRGLGIIIALNTQDNEIYISEKKRTNTFSHIKGFFSKYKLHLLLISIALLIGSVLQMVVPFLTKVIVDKGIGERNIQLIWLILFGEVMMVIGSNVSDFIRRWLMLHISVRVNLDLINSYLAKLTKLPMSFFETKLLGDLMQRTNDHMRIQSFLTDDTLSIIFTTFNFIAFGVALFVLSPDIFTIYLICTIVYTFWIVIFLNKRRILDFEYFEKKCTNHNITFEFMTSLPEIKLQGCMLRRRSQWNEAQKNLFSTQLKSLKLSQIQDAGKVLINEIKNVFVTVLSATAVINGKISFGDMLAIQYIIGQLNAPVSLIVGFINSLQDVRISLDRINEIHFKKDEDEGRVINLHGDLSKAKGIQIENLSFKYDIYSQNKIINNLSLDIPAGKTTAIVGLSGSGKTTLMKLILGFYDTFEGCISINGISLKSLNMVSWRSRCGVVMQNGIIFSESIARNIAADDTQIDNIRLIEAARMANILDFIEKQPLKFNTVIGRNGKGISEGQKQRILIARAIYRNPEFVFFDEATNSLDAINESKISSSLTNFFKNKTVLVIAHRLSTIKNADQIVVLDKGRIVEIGNHTQLNKKKGKYHELVKNQLNIID